MRDRRTPWPHVCIKVAQRQGCWLESSVAVQAALGGHVAALGYLKAKGCPVHNKAWANAAKAGHLHVLQWAHSQGLLQSCLGSTHNMLGYWAARGGHAHMLQWLLSIGCAVNHTSCSYVAISAGHLSVLVALEYGVEWGEYHCQLAAEWDRIHILVWLRERGCPWSSRACEKAAEKKRTATLVWAYRCGVPDMKKCYKTREFYHLLELQRRAAFLSCLVPHPAAGLSQAVVPSLPREMCEKILALATLPEAIARESAQAQ